MLVKASEIEVDFIGLYDDDFCNIYAVPISLNTFQTSSVFMLFKSFLDLKNTLSCLYNVEKPARSNAWIFGGIFKLRFFPNVYTLREGVLILHTFFVEV